MKRYVVGFLFSPDKKEVVLIQKNRPDWQQGKLNGVGGHIEPLEDPHTAMRREFSEETGLDIDNWRRFAILSGTGFQLHVFYAISDKYWEADTKTDEEVRLAAVDNLIGVIPNLRWLIPMALSFDAGEKCLHFDIKEKYV